MACAGYLVRNNTTVVYAEIANGLLVCTVAAQHLACSHGDEGVDESGSGSLPLLAPKRMERAASFVVEKLKQRLSEASTQPEDEPSSDDDEEELPPKTEKIIYQKPRIVQLSGHVVEVSDCVNESDDSVVALLPFSFRVKTKKMTLHQDATLSFSSADTLLLAAPDQTTKDEWMNRIVRWNRYGWRETVLLGASNEDADVLELALQRWRDSEVSSVMKPASLVFGYASAAATRSSSRRRFYRHTGSISAGYDPIENACSDDNAWFQTRVVKTHI